MTKREYLQPVDDYRETKKLEELILRDDGAVESMKRTTLSRFDVWVGIAGLQFVQNEAILELDARIAKLEEKAK